MADSMFASLLNLPGGCTVEEIALMSGQLGQASQERSIVSLSGEVAKSGEPGTAGPAFWPQVTAGVTRIVAGAVQREEPAIALLRTFGAVAAAIPKSRTLFTSNKESIPEGGVESNLLDLVQKSDATLERLRGGAPVPAKYTAEAWAGDRRVTIYA